MNDDVSEVKSPRTPLDSGPSGATQSHPPPRIPDHQLLRRIGLGSYGEVWLAQNVIGAYRAVKVVYRDRFEDERPYEREYSGIQKFEPISRSHEGLVDILQIGRNDPDGYFYYVMELAEDASGESGKVRKRASDNGANSLSDPPTFSPANYVPRTLRQDLKQNGRSPFLECLQLSLSLTSALGHLHKAGLVHRDIKPSNIIFVNGVPKLADIGLVTDVGEAKSFVGTEGFIPPEGPGTPQADVYSLGKVLYEIATGKDRQSFPEPPTLLEQFTDREQLLELNEIILKACETDPSKRYRSAEEMREELQLLQFGKSVKRLRIVERRLVHARSVGLAAAGVAVLAILTVFLFAYQARIERDSRQRVEQALSRAEAAEGVTRRESYANAMLLGHEALQENNFGLVRDLLGQTRAFASDAGTTNAAKPIPAWEWRHLQYETRDEAVYVFGQCASSVYALEISPDGQWLAAGEKSGRVLLMRLPSRDLVGEWQTDADVLRLAFSPDSQRLAIGGIDGLVGVRTIPSGTVVAQFHEQSRIPNRRRILDLRFSQDGARLGFCSADDFSIADPEAKQIEQSSRYEPEAWRAAISPDFQVLARALLPEGLAFYRGGTNVIFRDVVGYRMHMSGRSISPDGRWFAMPLADHSIEIWSLSELRPIRRLIGHTATVHTLAWSADGRLLATGGQDQVIVIWDVEQGTLIRRLRGHQARINSAAFSPDGRVLYSGGSDHTIRVWTSLESDPVPDSAPLPPETAEARLTPGAQFLYAYSGKVGLRIFATHPAPRICHTANLSGARIWGASPDGQTVVGADPRTDICEVWRRDRNGYFVLRGAHNALNGVEGVPMFSGDGRRVVLLASDGSFGVWEVEPWRHVVTWKGAEPHTHGIMFDPPGRRVFLVCHNKGVIVGDIETGRVVPMPEPNPHLYHVAISPDNRLVATSASTGSVIIWAFAPGEDPHRLVTMSRESLFVWSLAFSPDGRRLAIGVDNGEIRLWDIQHNMQVGVLKGHKQPVWQIGFNPEDESLVSVSPDELRIWRVSAPATDTVALSPPNSVAPSAADGEGLTPSNGVALPPQTFYTRLAPGAGFLCTADRGGIRVFEADPPRKIYDSERIAGTLCGISPDAQWIVVAYPWAGICEVLRHENNNRSILPDEPNSRLETNDCYHRHRNYHVLVKRDGAYQVAEKMGGVPAFSQDGRRVALLAADGTFGVWEVEPWRHVVNWGGAEPNERGMLFDPEDKRLFVICPNKGVVVGEIETGRVVQMPMNHKSPISHVAVSSDNCFVATASLDNSVIVWAFAPSEEPHPLASVPCEGVSASSLAFSPDGRRLALGMANGEIRLWDMEHRIQVGVLKGDKQPVWQLGFNPKDNTLVSVTPDELRFWPAAEESPIAPRDPARVNLSGKRF